MIALVPFLVLITAATVIFFLNQFKINQGRIWLVSALFALINFGTLLVLRNFLPAEFAIPDWFPVNGLFPDGFVLSLDSVSWVFLLSLSGILVGIIFTDSARIEEIPSSNVWVGIFLVIAVGFLSALSGNILTVLFAWAAIDLVELMILMRTVLFRSQINETVITFAVRLGGLFLLVLSMLVNISEGGEGLFSEISGLTGILVLLSVSFRLGVLPFNLPYGNETILRRGVGHAIRMAAVTSSLIILVRLPLESGFINLNSWLATLVSIFSLIAAVLWFISPNELEGRPYWIVAVSGLSVFSSLNANSTASMAWSITLLLAGSLLFLFSDRDRNIFFIPLLGLLNLSGLPFTPAASGWTGITGSGNLFWTILNVLVVFFLISGFLRLSFQKGKQLRQNERWVWVIYPLGLLIVAATQWLILFLSRSSWLTIGVVWASITVIILPFALIVIRRRTTFFSQYADWFIESSNRVRLVVGNILRLDWLYQFIWLLMGSFQYIVNLFSNILEGRGGLLWVYVLVAMLITILSPGAQ